MKRNQKGTIDLIAIGFLAALVVLLAFPLFQSIGKIDKSSNPYDARSSHRN